MIRKLFATAALALSLGAVYSKPAPAIDFICSCSLCTTSSSGLGCRDPRNSYRFTSCGAFHDKYCA
jgi:hypothetical protein